jgi:hypothetical protein
MEDESISGTRTPYVLRLLLNEEDSVVRPSRGTTTESNFK